jgi:hypothetical protein
MSAKHPLTLARLVVELSDNLEMLVVVGNGLVVVLLQHVGGAKAVVSLGQYNSCC